jgi:hypothetical protein
MSVLLLSSFLNSLPGGGSQNPLPSGLIIMKASCKRVGVVKRKVTGDIVAVMEFSLAASWRDEKTTIHSNIVNGLGTVSYNEGTRDSILILPIIALSLPFIFSCAVRHVEKERDAGHKRFRTK